MFRGGRAGVTIVLWSCSALASPHRHVHHHVHHPPTRRDTHRDTHHDTRRAVAHPSAAPSVAPHDDTTPHPVVVRAPMVTTERPALGTRSPGCASPAAVTAGVTDASLAVGGVERHYLLSVPAQYDPHGAPTPLVFAFHGLTGTPTSLHGYLRLEPETSGGAIFVYPAGQRVPRGRSTVTRWDMRATGVDVAFFDALLADLGRRFCVDLGRVYAVGHSAGAVMTNEIGCHRGNVLRAIAPIAGSGPWSRQCTEAPSVWITHGHADAPVPFRFGEGSRDHWVAAARCALTPVPTGSGACVRYEGCAGEARVVFCPHEGNHDPPPFAPREIWSFFRGL